MKSPISIADIRAAIREHKPASIGALCDILHCHQDTINAIVTDAGMRLVQKRVVKRYPTPYLSTYKLIKAIKAHSSNSAAAEELGISRQAFSQTCIARGVRVVKSIQIAEKE